MNEDSIDNRFDDRAVGRTLRVVAPVGAVAVIALAVTAVASAAGPGAESARIASVTTPAVVTAPLAEPEAAVVPMTSGHRPREATTVLRTANGTAIGTVRFRRKGNRTEVDAKVTLPTGLTAMDAFHGFHIHANDKPENGNGCLADPAQPSATWFTSADGHLSELGQKHSHHTGDMPSLLVNADGSAVIEFTSTRLDIAGLIGRAVVLHAQPDNFGNVPVGTGPEQYAANSTSAGDKTAATGNAGDRIACGVLTLKR